MAANKGGMATGVEVARISVKVSPDTNDFRRELLEQLKAIENSVKANINVGANTAKAEKQISNTARDRKSEIVVDVKDDRGWQQRLIDQARDMRANIRPDVDTEFVRSRLRGLLDEMKSYGTFSNDMGPDARVLKARWQATLNEIEAATRPIKVEVEVDKNNLVKNTAAAVGEAVETAAEVAGKAGKGLSDAVGGAVETLGPAGGKSKLWPKFGTGLNASAIGIVIAGALAAIGPLIGVISTGLLALPGLISLMLAPIAAVTLGLDGFKKAAEKIKPQFDELRNTMNKASETAFTPVLQRVADEIFPKLQAALPKVTAGLGQLSQGILDGLAGPRLENIITRIGDAFSAMRPGFSSFTSGFTGLVDQFTQKLPAITQWINEAGAGFDKWVTKVSADGTLQSALGNLGTTISQITSSLTNIGKAGVEFMADPKNMELALDAIKGIETTMVKLVELSGDISQKWSQIKDVFNSIANSPLGDMAKALTDWSGEGDKAYEDQSLGFKIAGPLGNQIQKAFQSGFGDEESKKYMDQFFQPAVPKAAEAGTKAGASYASGFATAMNEGGGINAVRAKEGMGGIQGPGLNGDFPGGEPQKVPVPDTTEAKAKLQEYGQLVDDTAAKVKEQLAAAGTGESVPPPNLDAFKAGLDQLPGLATQAMANVAVAFANGISGIVSALSAGSTAILAIVTSWPAMITAALSSMNATGYAAGMALAAGMAAGIADGQSFVIAAAVGMATAAAAEAKAALGIKSPSRVFMEIGNNTAQGMAIGLEKGIGPVVAQAKDLAWKISEVFAKDGDPTALLQGFDNKEVSRMEKVLAFESKRLGLQAKALDYQAKTTGNSALKAQADGIRMKKEELDLQKEMVGLTQEYAELNETEKFSDSPLGKAVQEMMGMPQDFARATGQQFLSDFGIDGGGALSTIADYGMGMANKYVFNVSNVDEAMAVHQNQVAKQGMGIVGR